MGSAVVRGSLVSHLVLRPGNPPPSPAKPGQTGAVVGPRRSRSPVKLPQRGLPYPGSAAADAPRFRRVGPTRLLGGPPLPVPGFSAAAEPSSAPKGQKPDPGLAIAKANRWGGQGAASCCPGGLSECAV